MTGVQTCALPISRREQDLDRAAAQAKAGVSVDLAVRVYQVRPMKKRARFAACTAGLVGDGLVELRDLGLKFIGRSHDSNVAPYVDSTLAKEAVPANMIEMLLCIDRAQLVSWLGGGSVPVDGLCRQRVSAGVHDQRQIIPGDKARIHAPGCRVPEAGDRVATIREAHPYVVAQLAMATAP